MLPPMSATLPGDGWYRAILRAAVRLYYRDVRVVGLGNIPSGPALWVTLHRNGAVDGMVYKTVRPPLTFLVSTQLLRSAFARLFFTGIPVTRARDLARREGARESAAGANAAALERCADFLSAGGELAIFPEGTSDLGPRHLPFKPGVARVVDAALGRGAPLSLVPAAIFYSAPERFRSDVTVVIGAPLQVERLVGSAVEREHAVMATVERELERLGVNVASADDLARTEALAALATGETAGRRWWLAQKRFERAPLPAQVEHDWATVSRAVADRRLASDYGHLARSRRGPLWSALWMLVQAPLVAAGALANLPVLLGAWLAGRRFADARNTIALWRLLAGLPLFALWAATVAIASVASGRPLLAVLWGLLTALALRLWPELVARRVRLRNAGAPAGVLAALDRLERWAAREIATPDHASASAPAELSPAGDRVA